MSHYLIWQVSLPNLMLFGLLGFWVWRSMNRNMNAVIAELQAIRNASPQIILGEQFLEKHFEQIRQSLREVTVRIENIENHMGMSP